MSPRMMETMFTTGSTMVLSVDHHEESMVDTSFTWADAVTEPTIHSTSATVRKRVILEVLLKFFILMWFVFLVAGQRQRIDEFLICRCVLGFVHTTIISLGLFRGLPDRFLTMEGESGPNELASGLLPDLFGEAFI